MPMRCNAFAPPPPTIEPAAIADPSAPPTAPRRAICRPFLPSAVRPRPASTPPRPGSPGSIPTAPTCSARRSTPSIPATSPPRTARSVDPRGLSDDNRLAAERLAALHEFIIGDHADALDALLDLADTAYLGNRHLRSLAAWRHAERDRVGFEATLDLIDEEIEFAADFTRALEEEVALLLYVGEPMLAFERVQRHGADALTDGTRGVLGGALLTAGRFDEAAALGTDVTEAARAWHADQDAIRAGNLDALLARRRTLDGPDRDDWDRRNLWNVAHLAAIAGRDDVLARLGSGDPEAPDAGLWAAMEAGPIPAGRAAVLARDGRIDESRRVAREIDVRTQREAHAFATTEIASALVRTGDLRRAARLAESVGDTYVPARGHLRFTVHPRGYHIERPHVSRYLMETDPPREHAAIARRRLAEEIALAHLDAGDVEAAAETVIDDNMRGDDVRSRQAETVASIVVAVGADRPELAARFLEAARAERGQGWWFSPDLVHAVASAVNEAGDADLAAALAVPIRNEAVANLRASASAGPRPKPAPEARRRRTVNTGAFWTVLA